MAITIAEALRKIKGDLAQLLTRSSLEKLCTAAGHRWRERTLGPSATVEAFLQQVLHGNVSCPEVVRLLRLPCTEEAYGKAPPAKAS